MDREETDWQQVGIFVVGLALGLALGAGAALLAAPQSGAEARSVLRARAGRIRRDTVRRGREAWEDLADEISSVARTVRRRRSRRDHRDVPSREAPVARR